MQYLKVKWQHNIDSEPTVLFSELDDDRMENRKVEMYRNGHVDIANKTQSTGTTKLSIEAIPMLDDIASDPQFVPEVITQKEFESVWSQHEFKDI